MPDASRIIPPDPEDATPNVASAIVDTAPATLADPLKVVLPSFDSLKAFEIRNWMPRGADLPSVGDPALVAFDEDGEPWLIAWMPA